MTAPVQSLALNETEMELFERDGFLLKRGLISEAQLAALDQEIDGLHEKMALETPKGVHVTWDKQVDGRPRRIRQLMNSEIVSPTLNENLRSDAMLDVVEALIGSQISLFHSKLLMKAALDGSPTPWHQDYAYWKRGENRPVMVNCMLAIDPQTLENGCIQFVPGSHKDGLMTHENKPTGFGFDVYLPGEFTARKGTVALPMRRGDCVFFNSLVIHGSDANRSLKHRRANTVAYTVTGNDKGHDREVLRKA